MNHKTPTRKPVDRRKPHRSKPVVLCFDPVAAKERAMKLFEVYAKVWGDGSFAAITAVFDAIAECQVAEEREVPK